MHKLSSMILATAVVVISTRAACGSVVTYSTRDAFESANTTLTLSTLIFEGLAADSSFAYFSTPPGLTRSGVNFTIDHSDGNVGNLWVAGRNAYRPGTSVLSSQASDPINNLVISFTSPVSSFGIDYASFYGKNFDFLLSNGDTFTSTTMPWSYNFLGVTSSASFTSVRISSDDGINIGNVTYGPIGGPPSLPQVTYTSIYGDPYRMNVWEGAHISFLTPTSRTDLNPTTMAKIVTTVDKAYEYYKLATGSDPIPYAPNFYRNGRGTIAAVDYTGGAGYSYLGWTGIELLTPYFNALYNGVRDNNQYDQVVFYELGRNFWHYGGELGGTSIGAKSFCTGFAVFMRYKSLEYTGEAGGIVNGNYADCETRTKALVDQYTADASLNFSNTLGVGQGVPGSGLGSTDLFASFLFRLGRDYGGDDFFLNIWKEVGNRPDITTDQGAIDNFFLASCYTAHQNLTDLFVDDWRWPISTSALAEAMTVPEPSTLVLLGVGAIGVLAWAWRRRRA
jgi:hypothetical protein